MSSQPAFCRRSLLSVAAVLGACSSSGGATPATTTGPSAVSAVVPATTGAPSSASRSTSVSPPSTVASTSAADPSDVGVAGPPASTVESLLALGRPVVLAHAGGENTAPHSTPFAFAEAVRADVDVLDFDLQLTKDGVLVVQHDDTTGRTTQEDLVVADSTFAELHALDNAYWFTSACTCTGQPEAAYVWRGIRTGDRPAPDGSAPDDFAIPSFESLVNRYPDYVLNIEIKGTAPAAFATADALAALVTATGSTDRLVVTSFDDAVVEHFHAAAPDVVMTPGLQMSTDFVLDGVDPPAWAPIMQVPPEYQGLVVFTADYVATTRAAGLVTWVWPNGAGEDVAGYRALFELGADGINASDPAAGVEALRRFLDG